MPLRSVAMSPMSTQSRLQSAHEGHLNIMKYSIMKYSTFVDHERVKPCAKTPRQISSIDLRLEGKLSPSTSSPPLPVGSPPKEPPPWRRRQGRRRGQIAAARAPDVLCRRGAPSRPQQSCSACRSRGPPRRRRPPRASGPRRCVKTCTRQMPTSESTTSAAPCAPKSVGSASGRALGWVQDSPPAPARPLRTHPPRKLTNAPLQRAPLAQPSAPKTLVVWAACCSILALFSRGSCPQRVR